MKRDMNLARLLLLEIESRNEPNAEPVDLSGYSEEQLAYHRYLIWHAGLTTGFDASTLEGSDACNESLSWTGHDFLDAARNETVWRKAMSGIQKAGVSATFELLKRYLTSIAADQLGMR